MKKEVKQINFSKPTTVTVRPKSFLRYAEPIKQAFLYTFGKCVIIFSVGESATFRTK